MNLVSLAFLTFLLCPDSSAIHPALKATPESLLKIWQIGYERAEKDRDMDRAADAARRGIGRINNKTVNWVTWMHPKYLAYAQGFNARKKYLPEAEIRESKDRLVKIAGDNLRDIRFFFTVELHPAYSGSSSPISRPADPRDLDGVRVVLKVGDRVVQPIKQPGDVASQEFESTRKYTTSVKRTYERKDKDGKTVKETETKEVPHSETFRWYRGEFDATFPMFDEQGRPTITDADRELTVVLIRRSGEQTARFQLADWLAAYVK